MNCHFDQGDDCIDTGGRALLLHALHFPLRIAKELPLGSQIPVLQIGEQTKANSSVLAAGLIKNFQIAHN